MASALAGPQTAGSWTFRHSHHMPIAIANDIDLPFGWDFDSPTSAAFESKLKLAYLVARAANERFFLAKQLPTGNCRFHEKKKNIPSTCVSAFPNSAVQCSPTLTLRLVHTFKPNRNSSAYSYSSLCFSLQFFSWPGFTATWPDEKKNILFIATSMVSYFHPKPRTTGTVIVLGSQEWQPGPAAGAAAPTQMHVKVAGCGCIAVAVATTVAFSTDHCTTRNHIAPHWRWLRRCLHTWLSMSAGPSASCIP